MTSGNLADILICHTTMRRDSIHFISGHVTLLCLKVVLVANTSDGRTWKNMSELPRNNTLDGNNQWWLLTTCQGHYLPDDNAFTCSHGLEDNKYYIIHNTSCFYVNSGQPLNGAVYVFTSMSIYNISHGYSSITFRSSLYIVG